MGAADAALLIVCLVAGRLVIERFLCLACIPTPSGSRGARLRKEIWMIAYDKTPV